MIAAAFFVIAIVAASGSAAELAYPSKWETSGKPQQEWSVLAQRDLDAAAKAIRESHPAALDVSDTAFHAWMRIGPIEASALASRANSAERADATVRYFLAGFADGHVVAWRAPPFSRQPLWAGWTVQPKGKDFVVVDRASDWDGELPALGARLISCDGNDVLTVVTQRVSPFVDRRLDLDGTLSTLSALLTNAMPTAPLWNTHQVHECEFQDGDRRQQIKLRWRESGEGLRKIQTPTPKQEVRAWGPGRYWVHATNFSPQVKDKGDLDSVLQQLRKMSSADVVVLDVRGNGGGDSGVGVRMLRALLKGAAPEVRSDAKAFWRISPLAISTLDNLRQRELAISGIVSPKYRYLDSTINSMNAAMDRGATFVQQDASVIENDASEVGAPFKGRLILVTDSRCASACLDFADMVLGITGATHVGKATSADTPYLEVATVTLPSGLKMWVPMKVWHHRARGSNVPVKPAFQFPGDISDTERLRDWMEREVLPQTPSIGR